MRILGIETSCDETAASVVEDGENILSNIVATSIAMHVKTGGIIPEKAAREQLKSIIPVIELALKEAKVKPNALQALAVTLGPGLIGSLLVGIETAKTLSLIWEKSIIPVNHLVGHIYANFIREFPISPPAPRLRRAGNFQFPKKDPEFPALALVVSGGHTDLVLMKDHGKLKWIGGTRDDAAGEAFDKCARLLGLPYPGGPAISAEAANYQPSTIDHQPLTLFPRPMINEDNFDFSFSGLKTAVLREVQFNPTSLKLRRAELAAQVQEAIVDVLVEKSLRATKKFKPKSLLLAGGVAANYRLREKFELSIINSKLSIDFRVPPPNLCTDNAAYIASCAYFNPSRASWKSLSVNPELSITG